jgi:signal transduction histidine kinase
MPSSTPTDGTPERHRPQQLSQTGQRVFECLSLGLVVFDTQFEIVHHNSAAEFLVHGHKTLDEALTAGTVDAQYRDWRQALREVIDQARQSRYEHVLYRDPTGRELLLNLLCIPITESEGGPVTTGTLVIEDITVAAGLEKRLAVSERMAAVGKLAARVAHELNNPLDGILRYLNLAIRAVELHNPAKVPEYLTQARGGLMRMADIIRELASFSRGSWTTFDHTDINAMVEEAVKVMSEKALAGGVSFVCNYSEGMPAARGSNLFQVFCNLVKNAIDAMPAGGTLTISTQIVEREVLVRFADTGIGLPDEIERIFEPFFTTKEAGKGTGLGLAICKDIVEKYNGKIVAERRPTGGSSFTVRLPVEACAGSGRK